MTPAQAVCSMAKDAALWCLGMLAAALLAFTWAAPRLVIIYYARRSLHIDDWKRWRK